MLHYRMKMALWMLLFIGSQAFAIDLVGAYHDALHNDPTYAAAIAQYKASAESVPQAIARLLPFSELNASYAERRSRGTIFVGTQHRQVQNINLSITQPIVNIERWSSLTQAKAIKRGAQMTQLAALQDLMIRTARAYFNVLEAQDNLRFTRDEKRAFAQQLHQANERHKVGLDPITNVHDAKARYGTAVSNEIDAKNSVENAYQSLREITGKRYRRLSPLKGRLRLIKPTPNNVKTWESSALGHNLTVLARRYDVNAAVANISIAQSGHFPTLDAFVDYDNTFISDGGRTIPGVTPGVPHNRTGNKDVGLRLNLPIFQGGFVLSSTRQARREHQIALADLTRAERIAMSQAHQSFNNVISGINQIKADRQVIISNQSSVKSNREALKVGTRTLRDVLDARQELTQAQQNHAASQYNYINAILDLKQAGGLLSFEDMQMINGWLSRCARSGRTRVHHGHKPVAPSVLHHKGDKAQPKADKTKVKATDESATTPSKEAKPKMPTSPKAPHTKSPTTPPVEYIPVQPDQQTLPTKDELSTKRHHPKPKVKLSKNQSNQLPGPLHVLHEIHPDI